MPQTIRVGVVPCAAWTGHASIATTNLYLPHLGTPADRRVWTV